MLKKKKEKVEEKVVEEVVETNPRPTKEELLKLYDKLKELRVDRISQLENLIARAE